MKPEDEIDNNICLVLSVSRKVSEQVVPAGGKRGNIIARRSSKQLQV